MSLPKYRMYIDEVGNHDLDANQSHPNERFLSLTGVILSLEYVRTDVARRVETLKETYFGSHPDDPIVLHRRDIVRRDPPFHSLRNEAVHREFDDDLLLLARELDYRTLTVVIDKWEHLARYGDWTFHPYHYCMEVLVERFALELGRLGATGDVMAESRGAREDRLLKEAFSQIYDAGTGYVRPSTFKLRLTSRQIKVKPKAANIAGLQLADLLAYPGMKMVRARRQQQALPSTFSGRLASILEATKYCRSPQGKLEGWGTKWLP